MRIRWRRARYLWKISPNSEGDLPFVQTGMTCPILMAPLFHVHSEGGAGLGDNLHA